MKTTFTVYFLLVLGIGCLLSFPASAQIPNSGFEDWSSDQYSFASPKGWQTNNPISIFVATITQSTQSHSDSFAVHGGTGLQYNFPLFPYLYSGFSINRRPLFFMGYYQYFPDAGDSLLISIHLFRKKTVVGAGKLSILDSARSYTKFQVSIGYQTNDVPDSCFIEFYMGLGLPFPNRPEGVQTYFLLDDLSFSDTSATSGTRIASDSYARTPLSYMLKQNYPNPFNPTTKIRFQIYRTSFVSLTITDLLGRVIGSLVSEVLTPGNYERVFDGAGLANGVYFYYLQADNFFDVKKMILQK